MTKIEKDRDPTKLTLHLKPGEQAHLRIICTDDVTPEPPEPDRNWPNMPANFRTVNEWPCDGEPAVPQHDEPYVDEPIPGSGGWRCVYNHAPGAKWPEDATNPWGGTPLGYTEHIEDASAPASPKGVYRFTYPQGMREGIAPCTCYLWLGQEMGVREMFMGMMWKPSANFDLSNNGTKLAFQFCGGGGHGGQYFMAMGNNKLLGVMAEVPPYNGDWNSYDYRFRWPNKSTREVALGQWHKLELYLKLAAQPPDKGIARWWMDGELLGDHADMEPVRDNFDMPQLSPTYGGNNGHIRPYTCDYQFDHVIIAVPETPQARVVKLGAKIPRDFVWPEMDRGDWGRRR